MHVVAVVDAATYPFQVMPGREALQWPPNRRVADAVQAGLQPSFEVAEVDAAGWPANPNRSTCTTSPTNSSARRSPTASTTCRPTGWVSVGTDHDTSAFAVATLRNWWDSIGRSRYPAAQRLLVCADGGGSNGHRVRAWNIELAAFAEQTGLHVTVCHLPPGTSKWNKIEHRLFSQITMNWRGRPLTTHQIIVDLISHTTTAIGLLVQCVLDTSTYPTGIRYTNKDTAALPLHRHDFHPEWNYTLHPPDTP